MGPQSAPALIALLREHDWSRMDADVRLVVLHEINTAITKLRERNGLAPIDDALPGQADNVFRIVRSILTPSPEHEHRLSPSEVATAERIGRDVTAAA